MIKEHDIVVLRVPLPSERLEAGDVGTVVHIHKDGEAYEVEFLTLDGNTAAVATDSGSDNRKRLNQLAIEANLWLPEQAARDLNYILTGDPRAKFPKELIIDIRHLLRGEEDNLRADEIVYFPPQSPDPNQLGR